MFSLSKKQESGLEVLSNHKYILFYGGARSGKTVLIIFYILYRATKRKSRHAILRYRLSHLEQSIIHDTFPKVAEMMGVSYKMNYQKYFAVLPNGSEIWFGGLDDKERTEKVLGNEYNTIFLNEASQISYSAYNTVLTRLSQKVLMLDKKGNPVIGDNGLPIEIENKLIIDENPPTKAHWTYKVFHLKIEPKENVLLSSPEKYGHLQLNASDNLEYIGKDYLETYNDRPREYKLRYLEGEFADEVKGAYFTEANFNKYRVTQQGLPEMKEIVVAIDPAGTTGAGSDETGIIAVGKSFDGHGYLLEDASGKYSPAEWAKVACNLYDRLGARYIIAEVNQGWDMVKHTIQTESESARVLEVRATKGKLVRAEPVSALYDNGKIHHVGGFPDLETEMATYTGEKGEKSPNRMDAAVYGFVHLFPSGVLSDSENFSKGRLNYFDEYDFTGSVDICYIKIASIAAKVSPSYNFSAIFASIKDNKVFVRDCLFNDCLPSENIDSLANGITKFQSQKVFLECNVSFLSFMPELRHAANKQIWTIKEFSKEDNRIITEVNFIRNSFAFDKSNDSIGYRDFMRQLNSYTNISGENESFAPAVLSSISYVAKNMYGKLLAKK